MNRMTTPQKTFSFVTPSIDMSFGSEWITADQLRLQAMRLLDSKVDITVDFAGFEQLEMSTLQILLALEIEQERKNLQLSLNGIEPKLLQWFKELGADKLLMFDAVPEKTSCDWN